MRRVLLTLSTALALLLTGAPGPAAGAAAATRGAGEHRLRYVALGDSYSAASGVLPLDPTASPACLRSTRNYPHVIAEQLDARLTDVTCGAAETKDFSASQYPGVAPQLDAVRRRTELVTMTIGGNDNDVFIKAILLCGTAGLSTLGRGSPCRDRYGASFRRDIRRKTYPALVEALEAVRAKAPRATVAILGYPWILPRRHGCFVKMPIARGDVPYLRRIQATLNDAVRRAADKTGATYVDLSRPSRGHDACKRPSRRWVEPVLLGTNPVVVHPNARGERAMARVTLRTLDLAKP
jgi:hypothetical protein